MRNPELMESSEEASSSPLAGGACFPRGISTSGFLAGFLGNFCLKVIEAAFILVTQMYHWILILEISQLFQQFVFKLSSFKP